MFEGGDGRHRALRRWPVPLAVALVCAALALGGDTLRELLRYERLAIEQGELWRLVGAHFVHLGAGHTVLNLAALAVLAFLFDEALDSLDWTAAVLASALAINAGLYWHASGVAWYVGLSGVLHGVMVAGGIRLSAARAPIGPVLLVLTAAKLAWERWGGPLPGSELASGGPVITEAHLYGAVGGGAALALLALVRRRGFRPV